jgi:hypothetical protein
MRVINKVTKVKINLVLMYLRPDSGAIKMTFSVLKDATQ